MNREDTKKAILVCSMCPKTGLRGDKIRAYVQTSPTGTTCVNLCFPCFQKQSKRPHIEIRDRAHEG